VAESATDAALRELAEYIALSLHRPEKGRHVELIMRGWPQGKLRTALSASVRTPEQAVNMLQVIPGSERFYCRAEGCSAYSDGNVPYGYCDRHLALFISGDNIVDKLGFPPVGGYVPDPPAPAPEIEEANRAVDQVNAIRNAEIAMVQKAKEQADADVRRLTHLNGLLTRQLDQVGLCPDHRDKFHGRCAACEKERAEARLAALQAFVQHKDGCGWQDDDTFDREKCTCGLSALHRTEG